MGNVRALGPLGARTVKISALALSIVIVTTGTSALALSVVIVTTVSALPFPLAFAVPVIVISTTFALALAVALALALAGSVALALAFALADCLALALALADRGEWGHVHRRRRTHREGLRCGRWEFLGTASLTAPSRKNAGDGTGAHRRAWLLVRAGVAKSDASDRFGTGSGAVDGALVGEFGRNRCAVGTGGDGLNHRLGRR
jgi:hypothetical protein